MRARTLLTVAPTLLLAFACAEQPRCVERGTVARPRVDVECSADKVPVCGDDPATIYNSGTGALLPVPPDSVASGSCEGIDGNCRPRPTCASAGATVACATGETAYCRLGRVRTVMTVTPTPDSGPPPDDAGSDEDAGDVDAGDVDAGDVDAGDVDAGNVDSGVDAG